MPIRLPCADAYADPGFTSVVLSVVAKSLNRRAESASHAALWDLRMELFARPSWLKLAAHVLTSAT